MRAVLLAFTVLFAGAAAGQLRSIPDDAERAQIRHVQENVIQLNGQLAQLAPGARIRDASNRLIVPMALPPDAVVKYRLDEKGQVREIWVLTDEEAAR
jgi:hypothetical protein